MMNRSNYNRFIRGLKNVTIWSFNPEKENLNVLLAEYYCIDWKLQ